ncbi:hypothetical protein B0H12DRAFT_478112 [Mycena haematopus]|nr:hypothetical protein B0H12DRAFT_478112 [Mycena haematopus]
MSTISLLGANLAVVVLESLLYGAYAILASYTLYLMVTRHRGRDCNHHIPGGPRSRSVLLSPVALGACTLFITVTAHWLLNIIRFYIAFHHCEADCLGPQRFYSNLSHITEILQYGLMVASLLIGESLIVHHLWVVWAFRTRIIIAPSIALIGMTIFGVGLTYQLSTYSSEDSIFKAAFRRWCTGVCFFSVCAEMYTTGLIWYKLWNTSRALTNLVSGASSLSTIIKIFLESAAIVSIWGLFHAVAFQSGSNLQFVAVDCIPVITGISNLLMQIRLHWDLTNDTPPCRESQARITTQISFATPELQVGPRNLVDFGAKSKEDLTSETESV